MGAEEKFINFLQTQFGGLTEKFLSDLKVIIKGKIKFTPTDQGLRIETQPLPGDQSMYLAIVDKSQNKDITKIRLPLSGMINMSFELPVDIAMDIKKR